MFKMNKDLSKFFGEKVGTEKADEEDEDGYASEDDAQRNTGKRKGKNIKEIFPLSFAHTQTHTNTWTHTKSTKKNFPLRFFYFQTRKRLGGSFDSAYLISQERRRRAADSLQHYTLSPTLLITSLLC